MTLPAYQVYAIKYAMRDARRTNHFLGGDPHDAPMPMDYFVWLIRNDERTIVLDVGFTAEIGERTVSDANGIAHLKRNLDPRRLGGHALDDALHL